MYIEPQEEVEELDTWKICGKHPSLLFFLHILWPERTNTPFLPPELGAGGVWNLGAVREAWAGGWQTTGDGLWQLWMDVANQRGGFNGENDGGFPFLGWWIKDL